MILSFGYPSSAQYTGGVVALYEFANAMARRGHEVHFLHGPVWPGRVDRIDEIGWFRFDPSIRHHIVDRFDDPSLPEADVMFSHTVPRRLGLPAVFVQGSGMVAEALEREAYRARCPKICVARWLVDAGARHGVPPEQLLHVPMGIDHELFRVTTPLDARPVDAVLLYNKHPAKGWDVAAAALARVRRRRPSLRVEVFGIVAPEHEIPGWMRYHVAPGRERLATGLYNQARLFVQPSWVEGFGFAAVEAMASGCALVSTDNGGSQDYAVPDRTAVVVPPGNPLALAEAIEALLADDDRRLRLARAGAEWVRRFSWDSGAEALEGHLERYLADPERFQRPPAPDPEVIDERAG